MYIYIYIYIYVHITPSGALRLLGLRSDLRHQADLNIQIIRAEHLRPQQVEMVVK